MPHRPHPRRPRSPAARILLAAVFALAFTACDDSSEEPVLALSYAATLESPAGAEGAAVIELEGDIASVRAEPGSRLMSHRTGDVTRVIVLRDQPGSIAFDVDLAEEGPAPSARVIEVSGPDDAQRASTAGYHLALRPRR